MNPADFHQPDTYFLQVVSVQKAALLLDCHPDTVGRMIRIHGSLKATKTKAGTRVYLWSIDQYQKKNDIIPVSNKSEGRRAARRSRGYDTALADLRSAGIDV